MPVEEMNKKISEFRHKALTEGLSKEDKIKDEIIKKINIEQLDRKTLNELIDMIYIIDKNNIKIEFKNI